MNGCRRAARRARPTAAVVLYALGLLALLAVAISLRGAETAPTRWAMVAFPTSLMAAASVVVGRSARNRVTPSRPREIELGVRDEGLRPGPP